MSGQNRGNQPRRNHQDMPELDVSKIRFRVAKDESLDAELFNTTAQQTARTLAAARGMVNASTQIRKFFEEVVMWDEKVRQAPPKFNEYLPFIRMINAKAVYAQGRKHVDGNFVKLIAHCVNEVDSVESMKHFKYFFEAVIGFYKLEKK